MTQPILAAVDPVTHALPAQTEARYLAAAQLGQPNGVAALNSSGQPLDSTGTPVPTAAALAAVDTASLKAISGTKVRRDFTATVVSGGVARYAPRPATTDPLRFAVPGIIPTTDGSTAGGGGMVIGLDTCLLAQFNTAP